MTCVSQAQGHKPSRLCPSVAFALRKAAQFSRSSAQDEAQMPRPSQHTTRDEPP